MQAIMQTLGRISQIKETKLLKITPVKYLKKRLLLNVPLQLRSSKDTGCA